ncbi:MAG: hypothetical protein ACFFBH_05885 [Promethearchaeota archaeon]
MNASIEQRKEKIITQFGNFEKFTLSELETNSEATQIYNLSILDKFFTIINKYNPKDITTNDINLFLSDNQPILLEIYG